MIVLSFATEKIVLALVSWWGKSIGAPVGGKKFTGYNPEDINIENISAEYDGIKVIDGFNLNLKAGGKYFIMGPSGCGKTTLLKQIVQRSDKNKSVMFQEDRLVENADAVTNILLGSNDADRKEVIELAARLLPGDRLDKKVSGYSGGMRRRVALLRALVRRADLVILDEPFMGLDDESKALAINLILEKCSESTVVTVTHNEEDAAYAKGEIIWMKELH